MTVALGKLDVSRVTDLTAWQGGAKCHIFPLHRARVMHSYVTSGECLLQMSTTGQRLGGPDKCHLFPACFALNQWRSQDFVKGGRTS